MIDLNTQQPYEFSFKEIINKCKLLSNDTRFDYHLNKWKKIFEYCYKNCEYEYQKYKEENLKLNRAYQYYQFEQYFDENNSYYQYHFDIENIIKATDKNKFREINISEFGTNILYERIEDIDYTKPINSTPVIVVPFVMPSSNYLLIDGNHRINRMIGEKSSVNVIFFLPTSIDNFIFSIDWCMYWFINEMNLSSNKNINEIIDGSILSHI